jgi:hypothetical protein
MVRLLIFARYEIAFLLAALAAVVAFQIVTGRINTRGLLSDAGKNGVLTFSPARLQLFIFTLGVAVYVLSHVIKALSVGAPMSQVFPVLDPNVLVILGGSHALYLGAKALPPIGSKPDTSNN